MTLVINWEGGKTPIPGLSGPESAAVAPNFYLTGVTTRQFADDGRLDYEMRADRVEHLPPNDVTQLSFPRLVYFSDSSRWHAQAHKGLLVLGGEQVSLETDVLMSEYERSLEIKTEFLILRPADQLAMTGAAVKIKSPEGQTSGVGMHAKLDDGYIKLLSQVKGSYARQ